MPTVPLTNFVLYSQRDAHTLALLASCVGFIAVPTRTGVPAREPVGMASVDVDLMQHSCAAPNSPTSVSEATAVKSGKAS